MYKFWREGFANDIIVVKQRNGSLRCTAVNVRFPPQEDVANLNEKNVTVSINRTVQNFSLNELNSRNESNDGGFRFTSRCLQRMRLRPDLNDITFTINSVEVKARMFLWCWDSRIVVTDVDGTITKSDVRGIFFRFFGLDWTQDGVCQLFSAIQKKGYKLIYLSGRPRYEAEATRNLVDDVQQGDIVLPKGPVIVSPDGWRAAIYREVWAKTQDVDFKIPMLRQIRELFPDEIAGPFHAGFGNRPSDERTYLELKIPFKRIFHLSRSKRGIEVKHKETIIAFFPGNYTGLSRFVDDLFLQVQDCAASHHFQTSARRVKEHINRLYNRCGNWCTDSSVSPVD